MCPLPSEYLRRFAQRRAKHMPPLLAADEADVTGPLALELVVGVVAAPIAAGDLHPPPNRKVPPP